MRTELKALEDSNTWKLVDLPHEKRTIGYRWVLRLSIMQMEPFRDTKLGMLPKASLNLMAWISLILFLQWQN